MKTRLLIIIAIGIIGISGTAFAYEYSGETPLYFFDYLKDKPIAYIIDYNIDGYLRNAVVDFHSNTIIFEIKDSGVLTVEIPKTHFLPNNYFPTLLIDKVNEDPREFLTKDEECFREYEFSVNQNTMIELIMDKSSDISSTMNENILVNCQSKIDDKIIHTFDFNTIFEDDLEYAIIDGKQYLSKTIKSSLSHLTQDNTVFELSEMKFHLYDKREHVPVYPGMGIMGMRTPILFEFPDGATEEISIKTIQTPQDVSDKQYTTTEIFSRPNWPEVGVIVGLTPSNQITKLLVFEKNISPHTQLQFGIDSNDISCKLGLELIIKHDGSPACVKEQTIPKLIERGWMSYANSEKTFLDKTVNEWESLSFEQVSTLYEKHDEFLQKINGKHFYKMLGEFLVKDKMEKLLVKKDIQNINDDFVVFAGMQLDSLPPRISYYAGVNSTDGKTYLLSGGSNSNKAHANNAKEIIIYDTTIQIPIEELVTKEPLVTILPEDGNNARVEPYSVLLNYNEKNTVEFYNTLDIPIIIESNDLESPASTEKWKTSLIYPNQTIAVTFNSTGFHVWDVKYLPNNSEFWEIMGSGDVGLFTTQSNNLEYTEKLEIAANIIHNSEIPVVGLGIGSDRGLTISLAPGITDVLPDAKEYYMERVKQLIPFDIPIVIRD